MTTDTASREGFISWMMGEFDVIRELAEWYWDDNSQYSQGWKGCYVHFTQQVTPQPNTSHDEKLALIEFCLKSDGLILDQPGAFLRDMTNAEMLSAFEASQKKGA